MITIVLPEFMAYLIYAIIGASLTKDIMAIRLWFLKREMRKIYAKKFPGWRG